MTQRGRNLLVLSAIVGIFIAFALAGRFLVDPDDMGRVNNGTLIVPHIPIGKLNLRTPEGEAWTADDMAGQWSLIYVGGEACDKACKNALFYLMTRLRRSLAQESDRVRLMLVHTRPPSEELKTFMRKQLASMVELHGDPKTVTRALEPAFESASADPRHHLFLAAPDGQIFMWYPSHEDREALLEEADGLYQDLTRTLKGARI
jgi:cytochrome oxidase Cu insertion factor (SCO1/SenC/PrrC family)